MMNAKVLDAMMAKLAPIVRQAIVDAVQPIAARLDALEQRAAVAGPPGAPGADGKSVTVEEVAPVLADLVSKAVAAIPVPKDGEPGAPGKDGAPGADGKSVTVEEVAPVLADLVSKAVAAIPVPKDGEPGAPGKDGVGLAGAMIDRTGSLIVTMTDGTPCALGPVVGKDGAPGRDGFGFDDMSAEYDGERTVTLRFTRGDEVKTFPFVLPIVLDRGVWKAGEYHAGDSVTFGGHVWVARKNTNAQPDTAPEEWRMQLRKPRDGRDGKPGDRGLPGAKGDKGDPGPRSYGG